MGGFAVTKTDVVDQDSTLNLSQADRSKRGTTALTRPQTRILDVERSGTKSGTVYPRLLTSVTLAGAD